MEINGSACFMLYGIMVYRVVVFDLCFLIIVRNWLTVNSGERIAAHRAPNPAIEPADDFMTGGKY